MAPPDEARRKKNAEQIQGHLEVELRQAQAAKLTKLAYAYVFCVITGSVLTHAAIFTTSWYAFSGQTKLSSVSGDQVLRKQDWGFGLEGVWAKVEYCDAIDVGKPCIEDVDQWRYFDNALNEEQTLKWKGEYEGPASQCGEMGGHVKLVILCMTIFSYACAVFIGVSIKLPRIAIFKKLTAVVIVLTIISILIDFLILVMFHLDTAELRDMLKKKSFISGVTGPQLTMGWSFILAWLGSVLTAVGIGPMINILQVFFDKGDDGVGIALARDARIQQYLNDLTNSSYDLEEHPKDSLGYKEAGGTSAKYQGWTNDVETIPVNQFAIDPSSDIGGYHVRWVDVQVPNRCCCFTCGTKTQRVQMAPEDIQPSQQVLERRKLQEKKLEQQKLLQKTKWKPAEKLEMTHVEDVSPTSPTNRGMSAMRPMSPKGPMGGTFSPGFNPDVNNTMSVSRLGRPDTAMSGFRQGGSAGRPLSPLGALSNADMFNPHTTKWLTGGDKPEPGSPGAQVTFSPTGQPLAERSRHVTRAPKPDNGKKRPKVVVPGFG